MKPTYFIDTSYIVALEIQNENIHQKVITHWQQLAAIAPNLVTTTYIFEEVVTLCNNRNLHHKAVEVGTLLLQSSDIKLIEIDQALFTAGWQYFKTHQDKAYSLTDCLSFIVMQQEGITNALTLDHHFRQAGFQIHPNG